MNKHLRMFNFHQHVHQPYQLTPARHTLMFILLHPGPMAHLAPVIQLWEELDKVLPVLPAYNMGLLPDTQNCGCACAGNAGNVFPVTAG